MTINGVANIHCSICYGCRDKREGEPDGSLIVTEFYRYLAERPEYLEGIDLELVPYALDHAVQCLRKKGVPPVRWLPYVYVGG